MVILKNKLVSLDYLSNPEYINNKKNNNKATLMERCENNGAPGGYLTDAPRQKKIKKFSRVVQSLLSLVL